MQHIFETKSGTHAEIIGEPRALIKIEEFSLRNFGLMIPNGYIVIMFRVYFKI